MIEPGRPGPLRSAAPLATKVLLLGVLGCHAPAATPPGEQPPTPLPEGGAPPRGARWYLDQDGDGWGSGTPRAGFEGGAGWSPRGGDCDDADATVSPGEVERCDGRDTDCDPATSEDGLATWSGASGARDETAALRGRAEAPAVWAAPGDGVLSVCAGTWYARLQLQATVRVEGPAGAERTVLDAGGGGSVVEVSGRGHEVELRGLRLQGGVGSLQPAQDGRGMGGGVACDGDSAVFLEEVWVEGNHAARGGGLGAQGCAVYARGGGFRANTAEEGGAVWVKGAHVELSTLDLDANTATLEGGAVLAEGGGATGTGDETFLVLGDCLLSGSAAPVGGAVALRGDSVMHCYGTNRADAGLAANRSEVGAALTTDERSAVEFVGCDLGAEGSAQDNLPIDVGTLAGDYEVGDDVLGWCWAEGCRWM